MSITAPDLRISTYQPVSPTTDFPATFPVFDNDDIRVYVDGVERDDFAVSATYSEGISNNAKAVFAVGVTGKVEVVGAREPRRKNRFNNGGPLPVRDINLALDTLEGEMQETSREAGRAHKAPFGEEGSVFTGDDIKNANENAQVATGKAAEAVAAATAAAAAATAAKAAANAGFVFDTELQFEAANIPPMLQRVVVGIGAARHDKVRIPAPAVPEPWQKQSADGAWWEIDHTQTLHVEAFGVVSKTKAELEAMAGVGASEWAAACTAGMKAAERFRYLYGGGSVFAMGQFYALSGLGVEELQGVNVYCAGNDEKEPVYPSGDERWRGTTWLLYGSGERHLTFPGITSGEHGGGWRDDPEEPGVPYKQFSGYNSDAVGTTPATLKQFSAGFWSVNQSYTGLHDCRIAPWCGQNGIEGYDDPATSLADDWDFGHSARDGDRIVRNNVQTVGYYRVKGYILATSNSIQTSRMEKSRITDCVSQCGAIIRSPDRWAIVAKGADWFEIRWSNEHPFKNIYDPSDEAVYRLGGGANNNKSFSYSNTSMNGPNLRFNGVSPSPADAFHIRAAGRGWAGTIIRNPHFYSLYHHAGKTLAELGLPKSSILDIAGFPYRGLMLDGKVKIHSSGRAGEVSHWQMWDVQDAYFTGVLQVEGGKWLFTADVSSAVAYCSAPVGEVRNLNFLFSEGIEDLETLGYLQQTHFPRTALDISRQLMARTRLDGHTHLMSYRIGKQVKLYDDQHAEFLNCMMQTSSPATPFGFLETPPATVSCTWTYVKIGQFYLFSLAMEWTGLDTTDTSAVSIRLPFNATAANMQIMGQVDDLRSTGINAGAIVNARADVATDNFMGITGANTTRVTYSNLAASGSLFINGMMRVN